MTTTTEPPWLHKSSGVSARNGTTSRTITFSTFGDAPFTPATGSLLVVIVFGAVTNATSGSWTEQLQPVSSGELSVFTSTNNSSTAPPSSITITNNGSNYDEMICVMEFPAGSSYTNGTSSTPSSDTWPTLSGLTGGSGNERVIVGARGRVVTATATTSMTTSWTAPWVEDADVFQAFTTGTDTGYLTVGHQINVTATSATPVATTTVGGTNSTPDREHVVFAINAVPTTTTITKDFSETYRVLNAVTKDTAETYRVFNSVTKDTTETYRVLNSVTKNVSETYRVFNSVTKDASETYRVLNAQTKDASETYRVLNAGQKDAPESYRMFNSVTKDVSELYRVLNSQTKDTVETYRLFNAVTKDYPETYDILTGTTITKNFSESYRILNAAVKDSAESYRVLNAGTKDTVEQYRVLNAGQVNKPDSWRVYNAVVRDFIERYSILSDIPPTPLSAEVRSVLESYARAILTPERVTARL
jgi:hypothetical protein